MHINEKSIWHSFLNTFSEQACSLFWSNNWVCLKINSMQIEKCNMKQICMLLPFRNTAFSYHYRILLSRFQCLCNYSCFIMIRACQFPFLVLKLSIPGLGAIQIFHVSEFYRRRKIEKEFRSKCATAQQIIFFWGEERKTLHRI